MQKKTEEYSFDDHFQFFIAQSVFSKIQPGNKSFSHFIKELTLTKFSKGEKIYEEGDSSQMIYLVRDGEVHLIRNSESNKKVIIGKHGRGSLFGEASFLSSDTHTTTAFAELDSRVYCIPGKSLLKLMEVENSVGSAMAKLISWRLHKAMKKDYVNEFPAKIHTVFYPEDEMRCGEVCHLLASSLVQENPGPVLLFSMSKHSLQKKNHYPLMSDILNRWPQIQLGEILLKADHGKNYDVLNGCEIHENKFNNNEVAKIIPALLGRLKKYYACILIDAGRHFANPVLTKVLSQSDRIILIRDPKVSFRYNRRWSAVLDHCTTHVNDLKSKLITVSDQYKEVKSQNQIANDPKNPFPSIFLNHFVLTSKSRNLVEAMMERSFRTGLHRLARALSGTSRGICFGGGGARAFAHIGVIDALEQEGIDFDIIVGTSMGAIIGAAYARGLDAPGIQRVVSSILPNADAIFDKNLPLVSYYKGKKLSRAIKKAFGDLRFEDLEIPFICNGCDLNSGRQLIFEKGFLAPALRGSTSLPGVFPPFKYGRLRIVDGGVVNNLPGDILRQRDFSRILGVNVSPLHDPSSASTSIEERKGGFMQRVKDYFSIPPILKIINRAISIQSIELLKLRMDDLDFIIHPDVARFDLFDFHLIDEIIESGRRATRENMDAIKESLSRPRVID